ncbi:hypothetical protein ACHAXS_002868 [Conticribra weissflogii]
MTMPIFRWDMQMRGANDLQCPFDYSFLLLTHTFCYPLLVIHRIQHSEKSSLF